MYHKTSVSGVGVFFLSFFCGSCIHCVVNCAAHWCSFFLWCQEIILVSDSEIFIRRIPLRLKTVDVEEIFHCIRQNVRYWSFLQIIPDPNVCSQEQQSCDRVLVPE